MHNLCSYNSKRRIYRLPFAYLHNMHWNGFGIGKGIALHTRTYIHSIRCGIFLAHCNFCFFFPFLFCCCCLQLIFISNLLARNGNAPLSSRLLVGFGSGICSFLVSIRYICVYACVFCKCFSMLIISLSLWTYRFFFFFNSLLFILACNHFSPSELMFAFRRFCFHCLEICSMSS